MGGPWRRHLPRANQRQRWQLPQVPFQVKVGKKQLAAKIPVALTFPQPLPPRHEGSSAWAPPLRLPLDFRDQGDQMQAPMLVDSSGKLKSRREPVCAAGDRRFSAAVEKLVASQSATACTVQGCQILFKSKIKSQAAVSSWIPAPPFHCCRIKAKIRVQDLLWSVLAVPPSSRGASSSIQ